MLAIKEHRSGVPRVERAVSAANSRGDVWRGRRKTLDVTTTVLSGLEISACAGAGAIMHAQNRGGQGVGGGGTHARVVRRG